MDRPFTFEETHCVSELTLGKIYTILNEKYLTKWKSAAAALMYFEKLINIYILDQYL